ncbi:MAG: OmpW family outer membrane protein [Acetobacteraceae bacterium]|nr:OmpW family outer membrane protein [Acetobacteraceae bacterium]
MFATSLLSAMAFSGMASAQSFWDQPPVGKEAGTFMIRARAIGVIPQNSSSSISAIGGTVSTSNSAAPELDFSYFLTDNIALELIAATTKHDLYADGSALTPGSYHVGSTWVLPPTLLLQYHFMPHSRFSPYIGAGLNVTFFYSTQAAGNAVTSLAMTNSVGAAVQAGFDYNITGHWFANFDVKQIFVNTTASIDGGIIKAKTALNPTVVGAGIGYRF